MNICCISFIKKFVFRYKTSNPSSSSDIFLLMLEDKDDEKFHLTSKKAIELHYNQSETNDCGKLMTFFPFVSYTL